MKKFLAILMMLVMVASLSVPVFAEETTGSITITNATIGQDYYLYKFFDATYAKDDLGNTKYDDNGKAIVSYTIKKGNPYFKHMFGEDGTQTNEYFGCYESAAADGVYTVYRKEGPLDSDVINYLDGVANGCTHAPDYKVEDATSTTVKFENIPTGYYLLDRGTTSVVTITSNLPDVNVIDKNQKPNVDDSFDKLVYDEDFDNGDSTFGKWVESSSANIGDMIEWKINFTATNYDGENLVQYYSVRDIKSDSLWVEFNSIDVKVNGTSLGKGYYWCAGDNAIDSNEWQSDKNSTKWAATAEEADWYLIHYTYDEFEIVIPWVDDYTFTGKNNLTKGYELTFDFDENDGDGKLSESVNPSPAEVEVIYSAAVGATAANTTVHNSAHLDWVTAEGTFGPEDPETTNIKTYNLGITKTANDGTATTPATHLAGAVFGLYRDKDCTEAINVIPASAAEKGVYILDDTAIEISGENRKIARDYYSNYLDSTIYGTKAVPLYSNLVKTPASGQVVIMGLEEGTYYLLEKDAPAGYNKLGAPVEVTVGTGATAVFNNGYTDLADNAVTYAVYNTTVINKTGVELPSTGGEGTMWLITIGSVMVIGFAVFLVTHKKMSVYTD